MTPYVILGTAVLAVLATTILALAFSPRPRKRSGFDIGGKYEPFAEAGFGRSPKLNISFEEIKRELPTDEQHIFGNRTAPPYRKPIVAMTPRMLEHVNIQRKLRGVQSLNRAGFKNAIAGAWDTPRREPSTSSEWLTYLILYNCFLFEHEANMCAGAGGLIIDPNLSHNGMGGPWSRANSGVSGDWTGPDAHLTAASVADSLAAPWPVSPITSKG